MAGVNDNLIPPVKGEIRNPKGKAKGTKHLSTIIQELADNIDWRKTSLKGKDELSKRYGKNGFKALVYVAFSKAMSGDTKAMDWLAKNGYGTKLIHDFEKDIFDEMSLTIKVVDERTELKPEAVDSEEPA